MALSIKERLLSFISIDDISGCWNWTGSTSRGYGQLSKGWKKAPYKAHRLSYELFVGAIPDGLVIRHKCDNPRCANPSHLEIGTQQDNVTDRVVRGRGNPISLLNLHPGQKGIHGAGPKSNKELANAISQ